MLKTMKDVLNLNDYKWISISLRKILFLIKKIISHINNLGKLKSSRYSFNNLLNIDVV